MKIVLFGAGRKGQENLYVCHAVNGFSVVGFLDNTPGKIGGLYNGVPVYSPADIGSLEYDAVIPSVFSVPETENMRNQLLSLGVSGAAIHSDALLFHRLLAQVGTLREEKLKGTRLLPSRKAALSGMPKGGIVAEVGVAYGDFSEVLLQELAPPKILRHRLLFH